MKNAILLLVIILSVTSVTARDKGVKKVAQTTEHISSDRFFFVSYRYTDACGVGRVGVFVCSSMHAYPGQSDLLLHAASFTCGDHHCIQITGVDAICKADFNALSK